MQTWSRRRHGAVLVVVAVVAVGAGAGAAHAVDSDRSATTATTVQHRDEQVAVGPQQSVVTATGTLEPAQQAALSFAATGTVTSVPVTVGQTVSAGQTLATIDPGTLQAQEDSARASVAAAEATVSADTGATTAQQDAAQAQLAAAQAQLTAATTARDGATLVAPFAGTVALVGLSVGQTATASAQVTVIATDRWTVEADVPSTSLSRLAAGQSATVTPTGTTQALTATVATVGIVADSPGGTGTSGGSGGSSASSASSGSGASATFPVVLDVTGSPAGLRTGASADVTIVTASTPDVLTVPTLAVSTTGGRPEVEKVVAGRAVPTAVTLGTVYGNRTQVLSGLAAGDVVQVDVPAFAPVTSSGSGRSGGHGGFGGNGGNGGGRFGGTGGSGGQGRSAGGNGGN